MRKIERFDERKRITKEKYDWAKLLDGSIWELQPGIDFECSPQTFQSCAHRAAKKRNLTVKTRIQKDRGTVQLKAFHRDW